MIGRITRLLTAFQSNRRVAIRLAKSRGHLGPGSRISPTAQVLGWRELKIGNNTLVCDDVCFNINRRNGETQIDIGDQVFIGRSSFFSSGEGIRVGDFSLIGIGCQFLNAGHINNPLKAYIDSGIESYSVMSIGTNAWLTNHITLIGGVSVGFGSIVGASSLILEDIPPLAMAAGRPAKVVKLFCWESKQWIKINQTCSIDQQIENHMRRLPSEAEYLSIVCKGDKSRPPLKAMGISQGDIF